MRANRLPGGESQRGPEYTGNADDAGRCVRLRPQDPPGMAKAGWLEPQSPIAYSLRFRPPHLLAEPPGPSRACARVAGTAPEVRRCRQSVSQFVEQLVTPGVVTHAQRRSQTSLFGHLARGWRHGTPSGHAVPGVLLSRCTEWLGQPQSGRSHPSQIAGLAGCASAPLTARLHATTRGQTPPPRTTSRRARR
jgi:hypothetical protein